MKKNSTKWTEMAGTQGSNEYKVVCKTRYGKVGFRSLGGSVRVRVEPVRDPKVAARVAARLTRETGWKQPGDGGQFRFSSVTPASSLGVKLTEAKQALGVGRLKSRQNPRANRQAKALATTT